ncbi:acyltransferase [Niveispirillum irakense]|uniref:acyltransferase n=1 Tax=Niveispirillum irakense TaxID=34011 RepID=UPI000A0033F1|nr:acyltransferase [Niveispirillum irakense]
MIRSAKFYLRTSFNFFVLRFHSVLFRLKGLLSGYYIGPGLVLYARGNIDIGASVVIHSRASISVVENATLRIGAHSRIGSDAVISCASQVTLGDEVLVAARCYIADYSHEYRNPNLAVLRQGRSVPEPVFIGSGTWLGINVCVLPGVTLGKNCVVAAGSVVTKSFPDHSVIGGVPARLLKSLAPDTGNEAR